MLYEFQECQRTIDDHLDDLEAIQVFKREKHGKQQQST
jgi:hypothetical protein